VLGDDLRELLGDGVVPGDHSRQTLADAYAARDLGLPPQPRVMDLGCGRGDSVDLFRAAHPDVRWTGVDVERSAEVAERVRRDAEFVTFDGERLPFGDEEFDLVFCKQVLEHVLRPAPLVADVARVLRPGGWFAGSTSQLEAFHSRSTANPTPYGLKLLVERAGLELVELRPGIDGFTLVAWRALGMPRFFGWWWARDSPGNVAISLACRLAGLDHRTVNTAKLTLCGQFCFLARRPR
jgi:SAM-dependent methyltransferase